MNDIEEEHFNELENNESLKEALETCRTERKSLKTSVFEVTKERDEALSSLRSSERKVYTLSLVIVIVAFGFTVAFSTRQAECHESLVSTKDEVRAVQKTNEQCTVDLSKCNSNLYDIKQDIKISEDKIKQCNDKLTSTQNTSEDKIKQCNDKLTSTQNLLDKKKDKNCVKEEKFNEINDKLERCMKDLDNSKSKKSKIENTDAQPTKVDRKLKKCQSCQRDMESFNEQGVHILKGRVLQVIKVPRQWRLARKDCQERGGDLVVPRNVDKLAEYLMKQEPEITNFWVGISDLEKAEEFQGVNGGRVEAGWEPQHAYYRTQNPSDKNPGSDCVRVSYDDPYSKGLVATHCEAPMQYICDMAGSYQHNVYF